MNILTNYFSSALCALMLCSGLVFIGCSEGTLGEGDNKTELGSGNENGEEGGSGVDNDPITITSGGVTLTVSLCDLTETGVSFCGNAILADNYTADSFGVLYSTDQNVTASSATSLPISDVSGTDFSVSTNSLKPATTYFYASYIRQGKLNKYSEVKSFTTLTLSVPMLDVASDLTERSAVIGGKIDLPSGTSSDLEYGFQYSQTESFTPEVTTMMITDIDSDNKFSVLISSLIPVTTYYYRSYAKMNGVYAYGEVKSFKTKGKAIVPVAPSGYKNLSFASTANCYIVSQRGDYCFLVAKGNQKDNLNHSTKSASVLWESFGTSTVPNAGDLIKSVSYKDGYIAFRTVDTFKEGNAVIAALDEDGSILWSWHIWLTDQPQGQEYYNNAGIMMDRNLGATSAAPGDVGALGLLYQWGRKDPFVGSSSISKSTLARSTAKWRSVKSAANTGTITYTIANPTTFIEYIETSLYNRDWYYTGSKATDDTRWTTSETTKSIYDPCPSGWRVPDGGSNGVWAKACGSSEQFSIYPYDYVNSGVDFYGNYGSVGTIWYPASGCLRGSDGSLDVVGSYGLYWSASPLDNCAQSMSLSYSGKVLPSTNEWRAEGCSVRCVQE